MAATITYKQNGTSYFKVVDDGENSAIFEIVANENYFEMVKMVDTNVSTYDSLEEEEWMDLLDSYNDALVYALEFVGGYPPHMPQPTRPK